MRLSSAPTGRRVRIVGTRTRSALRWLLLCGLHDGHEVLVAMRSDGGRILLVDGPRTLSIPARVADGTEVSSLVGTSGGC
ncbi:MAG: hypothetical protein KDK91_00250 [Gammaproteobacteria bacterium]|nr:hypothetical protein [Gammaproteobacteria bacterium]